MNEWMNIVYEIGIILAVLFGDTSGTRNDKLLYLFPNCFFFFLQKWYMLIYHTHTTCLKSISKANWLIHFLTNELNWHKTHTHQGTISLTANGISSFNFRRKSEGRVPLSMYTDVSVVCFICGVILTCDISAFNRSEIVPQPWWWGKAEQRRTVWLLIKILMSASFPRQGSLITSYMEVWPTW